MARQNEQDDGPRFPALAWLLMIGLAGLIYGTVCWAVPNEERDLTRRAEAVLAGTDLAVEFEGRYAILSGASSQTALDQAAAIVRELRGVHSVDTSSVLVVADSGDDTADSAHVDAVIREDAVTLSGTVPDQDTADAIVEAAEERFDTVTNELVVDPDVAATQWLASVPDALRAVEGISEGGIGFSDNTVLLAGIVDSALARADLLDAVVAAVGDTATVVDRILVVVVEPPTLGAVFSEGTVTLRGLLPDESVATAITTAAQEAFGTDNVDDRLTTGESIASPDYLESIPGIFASLTDLDTWTITLQDDVISVWGQGSTEAIAAADAALASLIDEDLEVIVDLEDNNSSIAAELTDLLSGRASFETGSAVLSEDAEALLDEAVEILADNPDLALVVEGHTDNVGDAQFNLALSQARAEAVVDYLVAGGVSPDRLSAIGYGESRPIADNDTEAGRAANRRIEFVIQEGGGG
jgi:OOP family OmpA-OmpF porin